MLFPIRDACMKHKVQNHLLYAYWNWSCSGHEGRLTE